MDKSEKENVERKPPWESKDYTWKQPTDMQDFANKVREAMTELVEKAVLPEEVTKKYKPTVH